jgi:hypothetical protein
VRRVSKKKKTDRDVEKKRAEFLAGQRRIARRRNVVGALVIVPLIGWLADALGCATGTPLDILCGVPVNFWIMGWAAVVGSFLGLTIRLILERRRFIRGTSGGHAS